MAIFIDTSMKIDLNIIFVKNGGNAKEKGPVTTKY